MHIRIFVFIMILLLLGNVCFGSTGDRWVKYLENDWQRFTTAINFRTALITGGWLTGMYLLSDFDDKIHTSAKILYSGNWKIYFNTIDHLGNVPFTAPVSIGLTGLTLLGNDKKLQDAAFTSTQALITSMVFVGLGKIIIGRTRPDAGFGPREFRPFTDFDASFPSGHTTSAFAMVIPWIYYYPHPLTYALLVLPASTAVSRMLLNRHWFTDVLTGAVFGALVGYTLARWHNELADTKGFYDPERPLPKMIAFTVRF